MQGFRACVIVVVAFRRGPAAQGVSEVEVDAAGVVEEARADLLGDGLAHRVGHDGQGETHGRGGTVGGDHAVEGHDGGVAAYGFVEAALHAGVAGGLKAVEDAQGCEHHGWRGADGGYLARDGLCLEQGGEGFEGGQVCGAGHPAGADEPFGGDEVGLLEKAVGLYGYAVGAAYYFVAGDRHGFDVHACAAHDVDGSKCLDFLETGGEKQIRGVHVRLL